MFASGRTAFHSTRSKVLIYCVDKRIAIRRFVLQAYT